MDMYILYAKIIITWSLVMFFIKWFLAITITTITLKLNYQKSLSTNLPILKSLKIIIIPSIVYVIVEMFLLVILSISVRLFLSGDEMLFFGSLTSSISFIVAVIIYYLLIKKSLVKNSIDLSVSKTIADDAVKYYVLLLILVSVLSMFL